jgi:hypothetical protein
MKSVKLSEEPQRRKGNKQSLPTGNPTTAPQSSLQIASFEIKFNRLGNKEEL